MAKKSKVDSNYKDWLESEEDKRRVLKLVENSGFPFELRVRRKLSTQHGFQCEAFEFEGLRAGEPGTVVEGQLVLPPRRSIDVWARDAEKTDSSFEIQDFSIQFRTHLLVECKHSSSVDFLAFELDKIKRDVNWQIPFIMSGRRLLHQAYYEDIDLYGKIADKADVIREFDPEKGDQNDRQTRDGCYQLVGALSALTERYDKSLSGIYNQLVEPWRRANGWEKALRSGEVSYREEKVIEFIHGHFSKDAFAQLFRGGNISINLVFPVLLIDDNRGVLRAVSDERGSLVDIKDIGICLYKFTPDNPGRYSEVLADKTSFPIIVCGFAKLEWLVSELSAGIQKLAQSTSDMLHQNPENIILELLKGPRDRSVY